MKTGTKRFIALAMTVLLLLPMAVQGAATAEWHPLFTHIPHHQRSSMTNPGAVNVAGITINNAIRNSWTNDSFQLHNLNGQYTTLTGTIGRVDGSSRNWGTIVFSGDHKMLAYFDIGVDDLPRDISVDVTGVHVLKIEIFLNGNTTLAFGNAMIQGPGTAIPLSDDPLPFLSTIPHHGNNSASWYAVGRMNGVPYLNSLANTWSNGFRLYNLNGQYNWLSGTIGRFSGSGSIRFSTPEDGRILAEFHVSATDLPRPVAINVANVHILRIDFVASSSSALVFANSWLHINTEPPRIAVTGVSIPGTATRDMTVGHTLQLSVSVIPANATNNSVTWTSNNTAVATVNATTGLVTGAGTGSAAITATTNDGGFIASVTVNVTVPTIAVTGVSVSPSGNRGLTTGQTLQLTANVTPTNATNRDVTWNSSNPAVATVSSSGLVVAILPGTATITATTVDGSRTASMSVTVSAPAAATNIFVTIWNTIMSFVNLIFGFLR